MTDLFQIRNGTSAAALVISLLFMPACHGQDAGEESSDKRMDYMREMVRSFVITPLEDDSKLPTKFREAPMLRFGDATRGASDGSLWKLGSGRPQAIVATEFTLTPHQYTLNYEFLNLTKKRFELETTQGWKWTPSESAIEFKQLKGRLPPAANSSVRLRQLKSLTRRFTASEDYNGETYQLRLMPQPIDFYVVGEEDSNHQGAVFVFANGTNPEVLLLLEAVGQEWQYGLARLCGASPIVKLDGNTVWTKPSMEVVGKSWQLDYTGEAHEVDEALSESPSEQ